ncbi:MAG TPA: DUF378 domain-containing protein [Candidatus Paceibacterota bacterium]|nr:DUF378 domain-containing protein [Candidatus Paceibacterota bacterium]
MKALHMIAFILVVVGAVNWGLTALGWNLVNMILGSWPAVEKIVYILVGLSGLLVLFTHKKDCKACMTSSAPSAM